MTKRLLLTIVLAVFLPLYALAQGLPGGMKGTVVNRSGRLPVANARLTVHSSGETVATAITGSDGKFLITDLADGIYQVKVTAPEFMDANVNVTVEGYIKDLIFIGLTMEINSTDVDASNFAEFDMDDSGFEDSPSILFGSNDPFNNIASFGWSSIRFKNRGYTSESQDVYLSGVRMNDAITGYSPFSLWSGLNEAMRSK